MRIVHTDAVRDAVARLYYDACCHLGADVRALLAAALEREASAAGREVLRMLLENADIAHEECLPLCQDTGMAVVFIDMGQGVWLEGPPLGAAVEEGVRRAQARGLRASVLDPLTRKNTGDNTPAVLHLNMVEGEAVTLNVAPKGFGSENMSRVCMLNPSDGVQGVEDAIVETVRLAGGNPCPPVILGVGIGGTFERCAYLAKRALLRLAGAPSHDEAAAAMERRVLERVNALGIGPAGMGGSVTALAVHIELFPTHIAALPVAVNMQCHAARHAGCVL